MKNNRPLIRRTFRQERFEILIKKHLNGDANFNDLTELDDIVNRDPDIRESILEEMQGNPPQPPEPEQKEFVISEKPKPQSLLEQLKAFISRLFAEEAEGLKAVSLG